jgi:hypothetical protein
MVLNQTQFYLIIYLALVLLAGAGEYLHMVPSGTFAGALFAVFGHAAGVFSPPPITVQKVEPVAKIPPS